MAVAEKRVTTLAEKLVEARLSEVLESKFDSRELRLSESGACPRRRVARALGLPFDEDTQEDAEYYERGNVNEAWVVQMFREAFPRKCRTQVEVHTPTGEVGHIDLWFPEQALVVEIKSVSLGAKELPRPEHVYQVQAYLHFYRDSKGRRKASKAEIVYIKWGAGLKCEAYPVLYDPEAGAKIEAELKTLHKYIERNELPAIPEGYKPEKYPCSWRNRQGIVRCPRWSACWESIEEVPALNAPELADDLARYYTIHNHLRELKASQKALESSLAILQQRLAAVFDAHQVSEVQAGGYSLKRTHTAGRVSYDLAAAMKANVITPEQLAGFEKVSAGYDTWTIKEAK